MPILTRTDRRDPRWRLLIWGVPVALLALPALAMRFTAEVQWTAGDFAVMAAMLALTAGAIDVLTASDGGFARKTAGVLTAIGLFLLIWVNLAVGMIGDPGDPANWLFAGVIATLVGGGCVTCMRPDGMVKVMLAGAAVQIAIGVAALMLGWGSGARGWPGDVIGTTGLFAAIWLAAAALYRAGR